MNILFLSIAAIILHGSLCNQLTTSTNHDNWAVIVSTSRYWFNYRHLANALSVYNIVKKLGIPDSKIIFLNTLDIINNARNPLKGEMYSSETTTSGANLVNNDLEIDFTGNEVNVDLFSRLLTNRLPLFVPKSKRLLSHNNSNILIYMSGHGGDEFFKFHDAEELSSHALGDIFYEMRLKQRYKSILLVLETCQAVTMTNHLQSVPNIITLSSSLKGENSYAYGSNKELGVAVVDRFTHTVNKFFQDNMFSTRNNATYCRALQQSSLQSLMNTMSPSFLYSTASVVQSRGSSGSDEEVKRDLKDIKLIDYFGTRQHYEKRCNSV